MKTFFTIIAINLGLLGFIELTSFIILKNTNSNFFKPNLVTKSISRKGAFDFSEDKLKGHKFFCDSMHTYKFVQEEIALQVINELKLNEIPNGEQKIIWFFGGSTTQSEDCGVNKNFPQYVEMKTQGKVLARNFGKSGKASDYSINELRENLKLNEKPDIVFWGNWINDFSLPILTFIENAEYLYKKYPELLLLKKNYKPSKHFAARLSKTLYSYINTYELIYKLMIKFGVVKTRETLEKLAKSENYLSAVLENFEINLKKANDFQNKYGFDFYYIKLPYRDYLKYLFMIDKTEEQIETRVVEEYLLKIDEIRNKYLGDKIKLIDLHSQNVERWELNN